MLGWCNLLSPMRRPRLRPHSHYGPETTMSSQFIRFLLLFALIWFRGEQDIESILKKRYRKFHVFTPPAHCLLYFVRFFTAWDNVMMLARCISQVVTDRRSFSGQTLSAAAFVRRMRGGAQSSLLRASDGKLYAVKLQGNPQGPNVLGNEALGSWLTARLGLKTPEWSRIAIDDAFLDQNQQMWFETQSGRERPKAGLHFASRLQEAAGTGSVYEILPRTWFAHIKNREDFLGMLLLDLWCGHADNRQACFIQEANERGLIAVFLDHGHMFGGPGHGGSWDLHPAVSFFLDRTMYDGLWLDGRVGEWMRKIWSIPAEAAYTFVSSIPPEWSSTPLELVVATILERRHTLQQLLNGLRAQFKAPLPMRKPIQRAYDCSESLRIPGDPLRAFPGSRNRLCMAGSR